MPLHSLWWWLLAACALAWLTKWLGFTVPQRWLQHPRMGYIATSMTVALLTALVVMNTFAAGQGLVVDARLASLLVAALALWLRLPFLLVVVLGAAAAALLRWWGWLG